MNSKSDEISLRAGVLLLSNLVRVALTSNLPENASYSLFKANL